MFWASCRSGWVCHRSALLVRASDARPLSVTVNGVQTRYTYAADGTRLKMVANFGTATANTTLYLGPLEIQNFGGVTTDDNYIATPHPDIRVTNGIVSYLHHDQLGSVVLITDGAGARAREMVYRPYGEILYTYSPILTVPAEARGFIGERFDAGAGLQYLNARYYDPKLGMFLQPDWFEVTAAGVGTNRYAYAGGDPVNASDPGGNNWLEGAVNWVVSALRGGSQAALVGMGTDVAIPDPSDVAWPKWATYAVVGTAATGIIWATNEGGDGESDSDGIGNSSGPTTQDDPGELEQGDAENRVSPERRIHILGGDGNGTGGGHRFGTGFPGKTEFPADWPDDEIIDAIEDVASGGTTIGPAQIPGGTVVEGTVRGVTIRVVKDSRNAVVTGWPLFGGPGVVRNPWR